mmetsp:Transcript_60645/g.144470  ORF Transcript_60645/g.144470 Transcript_60645/m.144470 type:complete len:369 (-) Transcript_60645:65-1171(-)
MITRPPSVVKSPLDQRSGCNVPTGLLFRSLVFLASLCCGFGAQDRSCLLSLSSSVRKTLTEPDLEASELELLEDDPYVTDIGINISEIPIDWHNIMCNFVARSTESGADVLKRLDTWPRPSTDHGVVAGRVPRGSKCAVVSNSGVLLAHEYGAEIDSADLVFRFNDAAVDSSVARHVGSREDFRVLNDQQSNWIHHPARLHLEFSPDAVYVLQRQEIKGRNHLHQIVDMHPLGTFLEGDRYLTKVAEEIMQQVFGSPNVTFHGKAHRHMTTGFHGMLLAASLCKEVRAYGMASSVNGASAPYHYYGAMKEGTTANDVQNHPTYNEERELWRMLATNSDLNSTDKAVFPGFSGVECNHLNSYNAFLQRL